MTDSHNFFTCILMVEGKFKLVMRDVGMGGGSRKLAPRYLHKMMVTGQSSSELFATKKYARCNYPSQVSFIIIFSFLLSNLLQAMAMRKSIGQPDTHQRAIEAQSVTLCPAANV